MFNVDNLMRNASILAVIHFYRVGLVAEVGIHKIEGNSKFLDVLRKMIKNFVCSL